MAVSSFQIGKTYRINGNDLANIESYDKLVAPTIYLYYTNETVVKCKNCSFGRGGSAFWLYTKNGLSMLNDDTSNIQVSYIEFVADQSTISETVGDWEDYATLVSNQFVQVSIYNEYLSQWIDLPCASEYTGIATTIVDSGRNASGVVIADPIASDVAKVEMKWNFLTLEQYSLIAQLFEPKYHGEFMNAVRFFDVIKGDFDGDNTTPPNTTTNRCRIMYCGDRKVSFARMKLDENGKPIGYQGVSLNLIDTHKMYGE